MLFFHKRLQLYELVLQLIKEKQLIIIKNSETPEIQITSNCYVARVQIDFFEQWRRDVIGVFGVPVR